MKIHYTHYELMLAKINFAEIALKSDNNPEPHLSNQVLRKLMMVTNWETQLIRSSGLLPYKRPKKNILYKISDIRNYIIKAYGPKNTNPDA